MSTGGAYVARVPIFSGVWLSRLFMVVVSVLIVVLLSARSLRLHRDLPRRHRRGLGQRDGEHAVLDGRRALLRIDLARQREAPRELERRPLLPVRQVPLRRVAAPLAADAQHVLVDGEL